MGIPAEAPQAAKDLWASIPQDNSGDFYAKIKPPFSPFGIWYKVPVWGQVCDGRHDHGVGCFLYNEFPNHGRGWTYTKWKSKPDNPKLCKYPTSGSVPNPTPFDPERDVYRY